MAALEAIGAVVLANACGPCIGQWKRDDIKKGENNSILSSFNRNFPARNDGNPSTLSFIGSPETVIGIALGGKLSFNPMRDELTTPSGKKMRLEAPKKVNPLPEKGFQFADSGYVKPPEDGSRVEVKVAPTSNRLQLLQAFKPWDGKDFVKLPLLLKAKGKCTTDHISPAGPWLKFRGHLDNISDNMFTGAINAFTQEAGKGKNLDTQEEHQSVPAIARHYKSKGIRWIVVGDDNYGEGSSREHAAMSPRHLNAAAVITKSFARIHETNLKKQGVLPLTFAQSVDYDRVLEDDHLSLIDLQKLGPGKQVTMVLHHANGKEEKVMLNHSMTPEQIEWFKAGSALNLLAKT
ncbi:MAG: aconitate hydratase, partial [Proteobacteria bacterium]|nr:aconitate hydratase [Pseudomonadota bacterium]